MKHAFIGLLAFLLMPVWVPLLMLILFYELCKDGGVIVCDYLERLK